MKKKIIETKDLCKSFVTGKTANHVLKNLNLSLYEGDFTVIMGSSGSGKSTLLYNISTMDEPTSGEVKLLGYDITHLRERDAVELRKRDISFIFQSMNLLTDMTVFENVAYCGYTLGDKQAVNEKTEQLLRRLGLWEMRDKYPSEMSGGMQQRTAIARALIGDAKIIFCDEPTGALNSTMGKEVLDLLSELNQEGCSIVMVTHDLKAAERATRLLYLTDGRIEGDLKLNPYHMDDRKERKNTILQFLQEHNW